MLTHIFTKSILMFWLLTLITFDDMWIRSWMNTEHWTFNIWNESNLFCSYTLTGWCRLKMKFSSRKTLKLIAYCVILIECIEKSLTMFVDFIIFLEIDIIRAEWVFHLQKSFRLRALEQRFYQFILIIMPSTISPNHRFDYECQRNELWKNVKIINLHA